MAREREKILKDKTLEIKQKKKRLNFFSISLGE